jgi:hypothetical protein
MSETRTRFKTAQQLLTEHVNKNAENGCWEWTGARNKGYGSVEYLGKPWKAHRLSYLYHYGKIPDGMHVLHKCDNPSCVNPKHLFLGTHQDNMDDMNSKHRNKPHKGEDNGRAKLTRIDVIRLRLMYQSGVRRKDIAKEFKINLSQVRKVATGIHWTTVPLDSAIATQELITEALTRIAVALETANLAAWNIRRRTPNEE